MRPSSVFLAAQQRRRQAYNLAVEATRASASPEERSHTRRHGVLTLPTEGSPHTAHHNVVIYASPRTTSPSIHMDAPSPALSCAANARTRAFRERSARTFYDPTTTAPAVDPPSSIPSRIRSIPAGRASVSCSTRDVRNPVATHASNSTDTVSAARTADNNWCCPSSAPRIQTCWWHRSAPGRRPRAPGAPWRRRS